MLKSRMLVQTLWCFGSVFLAASGGTVFTPELEAKLNSFIEKRMNDPGITGMTVAVVKDSSTWQHGYGLADVETGRAVTTSTLFGVGSITKAFTAQILARLMDESNGKFSWDSKLVDILGRDFELFSQSLTHNTTIKDMLTHRTGLSPAEFQVIATLPKSQTPEELARRMRHLPAVSEFRDEWAYNNFMYGLAGRVAEVMGGAPWEDLLRTRLLQPLKMTDTKVIGHDAEVDDANFAKPYVYLRGERVLSVPEVYRIRPLEAAGAVASNANDMAKWLRMLVNKGRTPEGTVIISEERMREMSDVQVGIPRSVNLTSYRKPSSPHSYTTHGYGYGWLTGMYRGYELNWHTGWIFAYLTYVGYIPDLNLAVCFSTNGPSTTAGISASLEAFLYLTDLLTGEDLWLGSHAAGDNSADSQYIPGFPSLNTFAKANENTPIILKKHAMTSENMPDKLNNLTMAKGSMPEVTVLIEQACSKEYVGTYGHLLFGDVHTQCDETGGLTMTYNQLTGRLYREEGADDSFVEPTPLEASFQRVWFNETKGGESLLFCQVLGSLEFMFAPSPDNIAYLKFHFSKPDRAGQFRELAIGGHTYDRSVRYDAMHDDNDNDDNDDDDDDDDDDDGADCDD